MLRGFCDVYAFMLFCKQRAAIQLATLKFYMDPAVLNTFSASVQIHCTLKTRTALLFSCNLVTR